MAGVKIAALAALLLAGAASAEAPEPAAALSAAVQDLAQRFGPAEQRRLPPSDSDPQVAADLAVITSAREQFGTEAFPVRFPDTFGSICMGLQDLDERYLKAGLPSDNLLGANAAKSTRNSYRYQTALTPIMSFTFKCMALHMPQIQRPGGRCRKISAAMAARTESS